MISAVVLSRVLYICVWLSRNLVLDTCLGKGDLHVELKTMQSCVTISKGRMDFLEDNKFFYFFAKKKLAILCVHMYVCLKYACGFIIFQNKFIVFGS